MRYFGSIRFFKNLILVIVIVCILIPSVTAGVYHHKYKALLAEVNGGTPVTSDDQISSMYPDFKPDTSASADEIPSRTVFISFDGGPSGITEDLLDVLYKEGVKATFFVTDPEGFDGTLSAMAAEGHTVAMRSYTDDPEVIYASETACMDDMYKIFTAIKDATGSAPLAFRMPASASEDQEQVREAVASELESRGFARWESTWSYGDDSDTDFTDYRDAWKCVSGAVAESPAVLQLHDSNENTVLTGSLPYIFDAFKKLGYSFRPITGLKISD